MIRIILDDASREGLRALRRSEPSPKAREHIEMVALSDAGSAPPRIAAHLGRDPQTVRDTFRAYLSRGPAALYPFRSGPAPDLDRRDRVDSALRELPAKDRAWTSRQLAGVLAERGIPLGARQVRRHLRRIGSRYRPPPRR